MDSRKILSPNSEFERQEELRGLLNIALSRNDITTLNQCPTQDYESIGLIGCILVNDNSLTNLARLLIANSLPYSEDLVELSKSRLSKFNLEQVKQSIAEEFLTNSKNLTNIQNKTYSILFEIL